MAEMVELKETLFAQQKLLHKLYIDLEAEREASATAAIEALSMILRLQGEKAAENLEASQYKRMIEEKMNYIEEAMGFFEGVVHQKEMEIASLVFQVQAYRYKLLSVGLSDSEIGEMEIGDCHFMQDNDVQSGELGGRGILRRNQSLPAIRFKESTSERPTTTMEKPCLREIDEDNDYEFEAPDKEVERTSEERAVGDLISYWEQIQDLDKRVKELSHNESSDKIIESDQANLTFPEELQTGLTPYLRSGVTDSTRVIIENETFLCSSSQAKYPEDSLQSGSCSIPCTENEDIGINSHPMNIHDIFEVPQSNEDGMLYSPQRQEGKKLILEEENRLGKPDPILEEENRRGHLKSSLQYVNNENKWTQPKDGASVKCNLSLVDLITSIFPFHADVQQLNKRLEKFEVERTVTQDFSGSDEEKLRLLKEIHQQLNTIQSEIRDTKNKKSPGSDEPSPLVSLMEVWHWFILI
ncbi:Myosin-binding protein [Thalictrum thalictroides]|uniref:Myosin-binding protein n=1 Tax=Thalictrum thalictroides TaxID=46969 RepID=A0A7J6WDD1_THATH|nr:Myosin-binding protein [Thalictrum thalictroides]